MGSLIADEIVRAADEGVPIGALKRIFRVDGDVLRAGLRAAVLDGRILAVPKEDWDHKSSSADREPTVAGVAAQVRATDEKDLMFRIAQVLRTTKLESRILGVLLRRGSAHREQLHEEVEFNRGNPDTPTDIKIVDVVICKLRKKLAKAGLKLLTVPGQGYVMPEDARKLAWSLIQGDGK